MPNQKYNKNKNNKINWWATHATNISQSYPNCTVPGPVCYPLDYCQVWNQLKEDSSIKEEQQLCTQILAAGNQQK